MPSSNIAGWFDDFDASIECLLLNKVTTMKYSTMPAGQALMEEFHFTIRHKNDKYRAWMAKADFLFLMITAA